MAKPLPARDVLQRIAIPLLVFLLVFLGLLLLSFFLLLPRMLQVDVGGSLLSRYELREQTENILASITSLEEERTEFLRPLHDEEIFIAVRNIRSNPPVTLLLKEIQRVADRIVPGRKDVVRIVDWEFSAKESFFQISGVVHNVGTRSMTVLSQLLVELEGLSFVASIDAPEFHREGTAASGFSSPFALRLFLHSSS